MADHTSAEIFGRIFAHLAGDPDERNLKFARWLWKMSNHYDFHWCQMACETEDLVKLGLLIPKGDDDYDELEVK